MIDDDTIEEPGGEEPTAIESEPQTAKPSRRGRGKRLRRKRRMTPRRWLPFVVFVAVVALVVVLNRPESSVDRPTEPVDRAGAMLPVAAGPRALSTAFFCSGGSALGKSGPAELAVLIANAAPSGTTAELSFVTADGRTAATTVDVPAAGRVRVAAADHIRGDWVAVTVEVLGPDVAVDKTVNGPHGFDITPCPTTAAPTWYVPSGSTSIGATETLVLYNPFPAPSSVDISFSTDEGRLTPRALRGFTVPAGSLRIIDQKLMPARKAEIASIVNARSGRLIVERVQIYDGTGETVPAEDGAPALSAPVGLASTPGLSTTSTRWVLADVVVADGSRSRIALFNPTSRQAEIDLVFAYEDPRRHLEVEPLRVSLPESEQKMVDLRSVPGLEPGVPMMVRVESLALGGRSAVPIVVEQAVDNLPLPATEVQAGEGDGTAPPSLADGFTVVPGSPVMAPTWLLATPGTSSTRTAAVVVANLGDTPVDVVAEEILAGGRRRFGRPLRIPANDRRTLSLDGLDPNAALVVTASEPVVVSRVVLARSGTGMAESLGAPSPVRVVTLPPAE